jgi:hypothetical protein
VTERSGAALLVASPVGPQLPRGVPRGVPRPFLQAPRLRAADGVLRVQLVVQPGRIAFDCGVASQRPHIQLQRRRADAGGPRDAALEKCLGGRPGVVCTTKDAALDNCSDGSKHSA